MVNHMSKVITACILFGALTLRLHNIIPWRISVSLVGKGLNHVSMHMCMFSEVCKQYIHICTAVGQITKNKPYWSSWSCIMHEPVKACFDTCLAIHYNSQDSYSDGRIRFSYPSMCSGPCYLSAPQLFSIIRLNTVSRRFTANCWHKTAATLAPTTGVTFYIMWSVTWQGHDNIMVASGTYLLHSTEEKDHSLLSSTMPCYSYSLSLYSEHIYT